MGVEQSLNDFNTHYLQESQADLDKLERYYGQQYPGVRAYLEKAIARKRAGARANIGAIQELSRQMAEVHPKDLNVFQEGVRAAITSAPQWLGAAAAGIATGNPAVSAALIGATTGSAEYIPAHRVIGLYRRGAAKAAKSTARDLAEMVGSEVIGENIAEFGQDMNALAFGLDDELETALARGDLSDALRIQAVRQALATIASGVSGGVIGTPAMRKRSPSGSRFCKSPATPRRRQTGSRRTTTTHELSFGDLAELAYAIGERNQKIVLQARAKKDAVVKAKTPEAVAKNLSWQSVSTRGR